MAIFAGKGSKFRIEADVVGNNVSISPPNVTVGKWDATNLASGCVYNKPTLPDPGDITLTFNVDLDDSVHVALLTVNDDAMTEKAMSIEYASGATDKYLNFRGWISGSNVAELNPTAYAQATVTVTLVTMPAFASAAVTS